MAWGSDDPAVLVLGFSKGVRQSGEFLNRPFEAIPFAGFRPRLAAALDSIGVLPLDRPFDATFKADERDLAFGSLIRCSVAHVPLGSTKPSKSGTIINALANRRSEEDWAGNCVRRFLSDLPKRLRLVVLMSNDDDYVAACRDRIRRARPSVRPINHVAYGDERVMFVHIVHCAGTSGNHYTNWMARAPGAQGDKARLADAAVRLAGFEPKGDATDVSRTATSIDKSVDPVVRGRAKPIDPVQERETPARKQEKSMLRGTSGKGTNPTRDAIIAEAEQRFRRHPDRPAATKYMSIFVTGTGTPFAVDTSAKGKQPIWVPELAVRNSALDDIANEAYPADRTRNSNLNVQGLKVGSALRRFYPNTAADASRIMDAIAG